MSRKPTIKISYPDASDVAMKLTEAMVRRAPGRRVVETTSEDSASPAGGELFADFDACSTSTSVDLTLTLNSASMDYALETLIRPNLTTDERKRILGEDAEQKQAELKLETAAVELAESINHVIKPETNTEAEAAIAALLAYIFIRVHDKKYRDIIEYIEGMLIKWQYGDKCLLDFSAIGTLYDWGIDISNQGGAPSGPDDLLERLLDAMKEKANAEHQHDPSWADVEAEARQMQAPAPKQSAAPRADEEKTGEIEPGLLNDLDDGSDGMAPAEEVMGHDE